MMWTAATRRGSLQPLPNTSVAFETTPACEPRRVAAGQYVVCAGLRAMSPVAYFFFGSLRPGQASVRKGIAGRPSLLYRLA